MPDTSAYRSAWRDKLMGYLALARVSNSPTVVSNVLAGAALAGGLWAPRVALLAGAMVLFYTAGMYLNDWFDYEIDRRERPDRPLPSGLIARHHALAITVGLFIVGCGLLWAASWRALLSGLVLVGVIVIYDAWHKTNPFSPVLMALTRMLVYVTAFLAFQAEVTADLLFACGLMLSYLIGLTFIAKSETKASFTAQWPTLCLLLPVVYFAWRLPINWTWILLVAFAGWVLFSKSFVYRGQIGAGITRLIAGISLLDALVLASMAAILGVVAAVGAFLLTLFLQRYIKGT